MIKKILYITLLAVVLVGCRDDETVVYPDSHDTGETTTTGNVRRSGKDGREDTRSQRAGEDCF